MRIGELACRTGVSPRALRYYEQHDLLHARRDPNGWRDYDEAAVARARLIAELIDSGLTIEGVKQLAPCLDTPDATECDEPELPLRTYRERLIVLDERIARLRRHRGRLTERIRELQRAHR